MPIDPVEIHVELNEENRTFYGYDWLTRNEFYSRKHTIETSLAEFLYSTRPTNKGTIHTLNMLINSKSEEERAAIWIYTFAKELCDSQMVGSTRIYVCQLRDASLDFLSNHFYLWHHAMKKLVPEVFVNYDLYLKTDFHSIEAVIELVRLNSALVLYEYVPILYTSLKSGETLPSYSVRLNNTSESEK